MEPVEDMSLGELIVELVKRTSQVSNGDGSVYERQWQLQFEIDRREAMYKK